MTDPCKELVQEYLLCMSKKPDKFPCEAKCKFYFYKALVCLENLNK